ncbi:fumarate reductase cytochrome b subunit [Helicobacter sp. 11S03491-1]|uniref:fumarate reductase cytochrome b subunit n=1 Tax=Helicobacter sp. 11S03491-1 TaxID=1476196 RepID=UPI000BA770C4|nr:fumarate reductase cytochrome b subunit [Helicobacter sp. 11S03491-1]PAF42983.1 succinate dehydrogenase/fumarate reductase cytochrome b subunit [Helicobacter sp. 11S03491-1]
MQQDKIIESYLGITPERKKSKMPAKLDFWQSATGLFLAIFMIVHMFLVSSILISDEAMYKVTKFFEGSFLFKAGHPAIVSGVAVVIIIALVVHALLAMRKFPINYKQFIVLKTHKHLMRHSDTSLWFVQAATGFAMFFLASVHLFVMLTQPHTIGPNGSAYRFVSEHFWILYLFLLFAVELHGSIGLYRLCIKWGWFEKLGLINLRRIKWFMSVFFIVLGLLTFGAYIKKGLTQTDTTINYKHIDTQLYGKGE